MYSAVPPSLSKLLLGIVLDFLESARARDRDGDSHGHRWEVVLGLYRVYGMMQPRCSFCFQLAVSAFSLHLHVPFASLRNTLVTAYMAVRAGG